MWYCKNCKNPTKNMGNHMCSSCKSTNIVEVSEEKQYSYYCNTCDSYTSLNKGKCVMCNGSVKKIDPFDYNKIKIEVMTDSGNWRNVTSYYYKNGKVVSNVSKAPLYSKVKITNAFGNWSYFTSKTGSLYDDLTDGFGNTINLRKSLNTWKFNPANANKSYYYDKNGQLVAIDDKTEAKEYENNSHRDNSSTKKEGESSTTSSTNTDSASPNDTTTSNTSSWAPGGLFEGAATFGVSNMIANALKIFKPGTNEELKEGEVDDYMLGGEYSKDSILKYSMYGGAFGTSGKEGDTELQAKLDAAFNDTSGTLKDNPLDRNILGLPLCYNSLADPNREVFCNTIMYDAPLIFITPGKPKMNKKLIDASGDKIIDLNDYYERVDGGGTDDPRGFGILGPKDSGDLRYLNFSKNYSEYWKYVQLLCSTVWSWIVATDPTSKLIERFDFTAEFKESFNNSGVCFYSDKSTSVSESNTNTYGTSKIADQVNGSQSTTREASLLGNYGNLTEWTNAVYQNTASLVKDAGTALDSLKSFEAILTKTANSFVKVVNGAQLDFPEVWQDSTFDRSYSLSFRFYSPYGDRRSIFKYVYVPFLALLAFSLPRQDQAFSYVEPFLVRVFSPGWINIDCGVITQLAINKGGSDGLWTVDGLPQIIEVTATVQDLYPSLRMAATDKMMKYNSNMCMYLETMAGIRVDQFHGWRAFKSWMNRKISNSWLFTIDDKIENWFSDTMYNTVIDKVSSMFR